MANKQLKKFQIQRILSKKLTDKQFEIALADIERKRMDFEENNFQTGYIQAMLNYRIISLEQYENYYNIRRIKK